MNSTYVLLLLITLAGSGADASHRILEFQDPGTQDVLIVGSEETIQTANTTLKKTEYRAAGQDKVVARESSEYNRENLQLVGYSFTDYQSGEESSLNLEQGHLKAKYRKDAQAETSSADLPTETTPLGNASITDLIERNWQTLKKGESVPFDFYVPFKLSAFAFQIVRKESSSLAITISVEPRNWLIRQFVKKAVFIVEEGSPQPKVKRFMGPSHIEIKGQANREVIIIEKP